jgi:5-methylcytosine-specific restriction endonuclease McrA
MTEVTPRFKEEREPSKIRLAVRAAVQKRSHGRCEARFSPDCAQVASEIHHKLRASHGGEATMLNLVHTCGVCHRAIHAYPASAYSLGLLIKGVK